MANNQKKEDSKKNISFSILSNLEENLKRPKFDKSQHDSESRLEITKLFLKWYFSLIAGTFIFTALYNFIAAIINSKIPNSALPYLEVVNTVAIITTTLSSGVGFVIGYYFKNKEDK